MSKVDLTKVKLNWYKDILDRINEVIADDKYSKDEKLVAIKWLTKQALKNEKEE